MGAGLRRIRIKHYRGAGILFWRRTENGSLEVLLGLRSTSMPHAPGVWSLFGGGMKSGETFLECAEREAHEETVSDGRIDMFKAAPFSLEERPVCVRRIPFFYTYAYFLCKVQGTPAKWPRSPHAHDEHEAIQWFSVSSLPGVLHPETRRIILRLRKSILRKEVLQS